jgi:MFS superfamily sulfate permease-like transporter
VLSAVLAAVVAVWCLVTLVAGLILHWPVIALGCLAAVVAAGAVTSAVIFRIISRQHRR